MIKNRILKLLIAILFIFYIALILNITIFRSESIREINIYPVVMLIKIYKNCGVTEFLYLVLGNIGWFCPSGFILPLLFKNMNLKKVMLFTFLFSLSIEISQYVFSVGYTELDDLILNTLGGFLGYLAYVKSLKVQDL